MKRARSTRWWIESLVAIAAISGFVFYQGRSWADLSEVKTLVVLAIVEGLRAFRNELSQE